MRSASTASGGRGRRDRRPRGDAALIARRRFLRLLSRAGATAALPFAAGCDVREYARSHGARLRLSIATGQVGGVWYVLGAGLGRIISEHVPNVRVTAELTAASVDNLRFLRAGQVDLALALGPTLADAHRGTGPFAAAGRVPVRTLAVLYLQAMHLVVFAGSGIARVADLRGHVVSTQNPGSGTEVIALRMLEAAGLDPDRDVVRETLGPGQAADAMKDGKLDAFFFSTGVPSPVVRELATTYGASLRLVPSSDLLPAFQQLFGAEEFPLAVIPARSYPGQTSDVPTIGSATILVADERLSEDLAHEITRVLFDHAAELAAIHPVAKTFSVARGASGSPAPYHPGAIRFYRERGAWPA